MREIEPILPPELRSTLDAYYTAPQPDSAFAERLEVQLRKQHAGLIVRTPTASFHRSRLRSSFMLSLRTRPMLALLAALLALLLLTGIAYAVGRLTGFIPGIGFVDDVQSILETPITVNQSLEATAPAASPGEAGTPMPRIASETVFEGTATTPGELDTAAPAGPISSQERQGITLTIEQVVSETDRLVIAYKISGLPADIFGPERAKKFAAEANAEDPFLVNVRLPEGTVLTLADGGHCSGAGDGVTSWLSCRLVRSPLPEGVNQFTLEMQRLPNSLPGELPENWAIPIRLTPLTPAQGANAVQNLDLRSPQINGVTMRLIKAVQTSSETAFQLAMEWEGSNRFLHHTAPITLQDAQGRYYILTGGPDGGAYSIENPHYFSLPSVVTSPVDGSNPITFRLDWAILSISGAVVDDPAGAPILRVDAGQSASIGHEWRIDQTIQAGEFALHFIQARLKPGQDGSVILEIDAQPQPGITSLNLFPAEGASSYEAGYDKVRGVLVSRISLPALPTKPLDLYISEILYKVNGPWEITWQPQPMAVTTVKPAPATTRVAPPAPTLVPDQPLLEEFQALRASALIPGGPGWVHQVMQFEQAEPVDTLDTGDLPEQPQRYRTDAWFLLDQDGYIRTTIYLRKTLDGRLLGADIDSGLYHFSLPEARGGIGQDLYIAKPSYDWDQIAYFNSVVSGGGTLRQENGAVDGKSCQLYIGTMPYDPPMVFSNEPLPVQAMIHSACIDPENGTVLQTQNQMTYSDGTTHVKDTTWFISIEKVDSLPEEVREILDQVIMP